MIEKTDQNPKSQLEEKEQLLFRRRDRLQKWYYFWLAFLLLLVVYTSTIPFLKNETGTSKLEYFFFSAAMNAAMVVPVMLIIRARLRNVEEDIQDLEFEIDLRNFEVDKRETRAEKILWINNTQLRRYYDLNLKQNIGVFALGVSCIILGSCVIVITLYLILSIAKSTETQIIIGIVGAIGSFFTNYIA